MLTSTAWILAAMALVAALERFVPLHVRARERRAHLVPNLALTAITFAVNALLTAALVTGLAGLESRDLGLLRALALPAWASIAAAIVALDFATWLAHTSMHRVPLFWRFHRVHHADRLVDVTTSIRQHPGETAVRALFLAAFAVPLGVGPATFALYRTLSAANSLLEHANLRVPRRFDSALSLLVVTPNAHKVHHSRRPALTDTNFGNLSRSSIASLVCSRGPSAGSRSSTASTASTIRRARRSRRCCASPSAPRPANRRLR
ncbi:MAG TPA: sterol desaturase family protein [Myxococcota bacterium]|nr:sterol desaturase family protein [Myxococcota bacterium]